MESTEKSHDNQEKVLTSIHDVYTLNTTRKLGGEVDEVIVKTFLNTLAEVALAVADRKQRTNRY